MEFVKRVGPIDIKEIDKGVKVGIGWTRKTQISNSYWITTTFEGHDSSVLSIMFITNGKQILSSGSDGLLKLWQIKTSECMKTFDGHDAKVWAVGGTKEEDFFISGGADSTLVLWKVLNLPPDLEHLALVDNVLVAVDLDKKYRWMVSSYGFHDRQL